VKWIGQHIWSFISRFRSDVYLESLATTTETNVLVVDSAGKVSKSTSVAGDLTSIVAGTGLSGTSLTGPIPTLNVDVSDFMTNGVDNRIVTATGTDAMNAEANFTYDGNDALFASTGSFKPILTLQQTLAGAAGGPTLIYNKAGRTGADGDLIGQVYFKALNDADEVITFANIQAKIGDASDGGETGELHFGASTVSTINDLKVAGALTMGSTAAMTSAGLLSVANQSNITGVGTISSGTWQGTTIKTAYIGDDQVTEDKLADTLLAEIDANTAKVSFPTGITYASEILTVGDDDNGKAFITRKTHSDDAGGVLSVSAGNATGTNKAGGNLLLEAGRGTGSATGGLIQFYSSAAGGSATTLRSSAVIAELDNVGNLQIDGKLTVTGNIIEDDDHVQCITFDSSGNTTILNTLNASVTGDITGNADTATALATGNQIITGNLTVNASSSTGNPLLTFTQNGTRRAFIQLADNSGGYTNNLRINSEYGAITLGAASTDGSDSDTAYFAIEPTGIFKFGAVDSDATLTTDGNMTFRIDADNDETGQGFAWQNNASTEIASLDESGNLQIDGKLQVTGNIIEDDDGVDCITFDSSGNTTIAGTLSCADLDITGTSNALTVNPQTGNVAITCISTDADCMVRVQDNSTAGTNVLGLVATGDDIVLRNDEGSFKVKIANNATTGLELDQSGNLSITGNILPGITYVKILPSDFMPDDGGRPAMIDDTSGDRWLESHGTLKLFAFVEIPLGFKATLVDIYGSATSAITVYEADVNSATVTSKGTGNIGTQINITDVTADATNYIMIELAQASGEKVYGGSMTIAAV